MDYRHARAGSHFRSHATSAVVVIAWALIANAVGGCGSDATSTAPGDVDGGTSDAPLDPVVEAGTDGNGDSSTPDRGDADAEDLSDVPDADGEPTEPGLEPLPPLAEVALTTEAVIEPVRPVQDLRRGDPREPDRVASLLSDGYGDYTVEPVEGDLLDRTLDDGSAPEPGASPVLVARFVHLADIQLADDESPVRAVFLDTPGIISGAFRPQEGHECHILNAAVRTINALHAEQPIDAVVLGGDNIDNAQSNELAWLHAVLDGAPSLSCDSGVDDDPVPGPSNDPKDPFHPVGLDIPWFWVTGNHDILGQGNLPVDPFRLKAVGDWSDSGTRDWSQPGGPITSGLVPADERRALLDRWELISAVAEIGGGHGLGADQVGSGYANYVADIAGGPVRLIVVDTAAETGGAPGLVRRGVLDGFLTNALDEASALGRWVIVVTHHASSSLTDGGDYGGEVQSDAITATQWRELLASYDNVIMHLAGHSHEHRIERIETDAGDSYWEVRTAALADYPHQMNLIEIRDEDNGYISISATALDYATDGDPIAEEGRRLGILDATTGWAFDGSGTQTDRNVRLWVPRP